MDSKGQSTMGTYYDYNDATYVRLYSNTFVSSIHTLTIYLHPYGIEKLGLIAHLLKKIDKRVGRDAGSLKFSFFLHCTAGHVIKKAKRCYRDMEMGCVCVYIV